MLWNAFSETEFVDVHQILQSLCQKMYETSPRQESGQTCNFGFIFVATPLLYHQTY